MKLNVESKNEILALWETRVRKSCIDIKDHELLKLKPLLPKFLDYLFAVLKKEEYLSETEVIPVVSKIIVPVIDDYSLSEVLREYSILRTAVLDVLGRETLISPVDQLTIHRLIDAAGIIAGTLFSDKRMKIDEALSVELKRSNLELERFAAIAAHDLRSPLTTIIGFVSILEDEFENQNDDVKKSFKVIQSNSERMLLLIDRLLAYARLGNTKPNFEDVDLNHVIENLISGESVNEKAKILYKDLPTIKADTSIVHQLFQNLIANSIKFRGVDFPTIHVALENEDEKEWNLSVADNGMGFDETQSEAIFEPFKQLNNMNDYQGSGLGLATVKRVVNILGGEISCKSEIGVGSKFIFSISKNPSIVLQ
jgi:signal transduction histidine kinase